MKRSPPQKAGADPCVPQAAGTRALCLAARVSPYGHGAARGRNDHPAEVAIIALFVRITGPQLPTRTPCQSSVSLCETTTLSILAASIGSVAVKSTYRETR